MSETRLMPSEYGRVYDVNPDVSKGELNCRRYRVKQNGCILHFIYRVEFDADADSGPATIYAIMNCGLDKPFYVLDETGSDVVRVSFRANVEVVRKECVENSMREKS